MKNKIEGEEGARKILAFMEQWLAEPNSDWLLGSNSDYSLVDVFATTFLVRLNANPTFFKKEVRGRPLVSKYYDKVMARPSIKEASIGPPPVPTLPKMIFGLTMIFTLLSAIVAGIIYGVKSSFDSPTNFYFTWLYSFITIICLFLVFFTYLSCIGRKRLAE